MLSELERERLWNLWVERGALDQIIPDRDLLAALDAADHLPDGRGYLDRLCAFGWYEQVEPDHASNDPEWWDHGWFPVPEYQLLRPLGRGGAGTVWEARHGGMETALKLIRLQGQFSMGQLELESLELIRDGKLKVRNIIRIQGIWSVDAYGNPVSDVSAANWVVIAMEKADRTLDDAFKKYTRDSNASGIPREPLLTWLGQAAEGLDSLSSCTDAGTRAIQHCDIKPSNLLLQGNHVVISDFGLMQRLDQTVCPHRGGLTLPYAPHEFFGTNPTVNRFSDQFSLAVTYCFLLTGRHPFPGMLRGEATLRSLPETEQGIVARALNIDPFQRWPSCGEFITQLLIASPDSETETVIDPVRPTDDSGPAIPDDGSGSDSQRIATFLMKRYESGRTDNDFYVDPECNLTLMSGETQRTQLTPAFLTDFAGGDELQRLVVISDFGMGKSSLTERCEFNQALELSRQPAARIPVRVELKQWNPDEELQSFVLASLQQLLHDAGVDRTLTPDEFRTRQLEGRFLFLLDGLDEVVCDGDPASLTMVRLVELIEPVSHTPGNRTILTMRPNILMRPGILQDQQERSRLRSEKRFAILELRDWTWDGEVVPYLKHRWGNQYERRIGRLRSLNRVARLLKRPLFAWMLAETFPEHFEGQEYDVIALYEHFINYCYHRDACLAKLFGRFRLQFEAAGAYDAGYAETVNSFMVEVARFLFRKGQRATSEATLSASELRELTREHLSFSENDASFQAAVETAARERLLLVPVPSSRNRQQFELRFAHAAFQSYFLATGLARVLADEGRAGVDRLLAAQMPDEAAFDFLVAYTQANNEDGRFGDAVSEAVKHHRKQDGASLVFAFYEVLRLVLGGEAKKSTRALFRNRDKSPEGFALAMHWMHDMNLTGARLHGVDFTGEKFTASMNLRGAKLDEARFDDCVLEKACLDEASASGASFVGTRLIKADLKDTKLDQTCFDDADLSKADLRNASLKGAAFRRANLSRTRFSGCDLGDDPDTWPIIEGANLNPPPILGGGIRISDDGTRLQPVETSA